MLLYARETRKILARIMTNRSLTLEEAIELSPLEEHYDENDGWYYTDRDGNEYGYDDLGLAMDSEEENGYIKESEY